MTWLTDSAQLIAGTWLTSLYSGHGVLGADVPDTGIDGFAGFGYADLDPSDAAKEVRWVIVRWPVAGLLEVREDSSFRFSGAPAGRYFFDAEAFLEGRSVGIKRVLLLVGPQPSLIEQLQTELSPLATGQAHYMVNMRDAKAYPFITVSRVASSANAGLTGPSDLQNVRIQVDIHARTIAEAHAVQRVVEAAMAEWTVQNVPITSLDLFEEATQTFRVSLDYSVWTYSP